MNYTIATLKDVQGDIKVNFVVNGNQYYIGLYNEETDEYTTKTFDTIEEAQAVFNKFVSAILTGCYSYEQRKSWLA